MADLQKFGTALDQMVQLMMEMKKALNEESKNPPVVATPVQPQVVQPAPQVAPPVLAQQDPYESLVTTLHSNKWPEAVNPNLICNPQSETDKQDRGRGIIELMIEEDLKELKFLDFGCGEGHAAGLAVEYKPALSVGYDIKAHPAWNNFTPSDNLQFTTDFAQVTQQGPYNIVLMFDVLDHALSEDGASILQKAKSVLAPNGKIYLRCHPFTSRHATHLYHTLNKAYVHLVFTDEELQAIVPNAPYKEDSNRIVTPLKTYGEIIEQAGLKIINKREVTEQVEPFFKTPQVAERIMRNINFQQFPEFQMSMQFIDYVLGNP